MALPSISDLASSLRWTPDPRSGVGTGRGRMMHADQISETIEGVVSAPEKSSAVSGPEDRKGIFEFLTDILRQLDPSAWLPALVLVCNLAVVYQMSRRRSADVGAAVAALVDSGWALIVGLLLSLVVATMVTGAFAFEAIHFLQGDWPDWPLLAPIRDVLTWRQQRIVGRAQAREARLLLKAFRKVKYQLLENPSIPREDVARIEDSVVKAAANKIRSCDARVNAHQANESIPWEDYAPLHLMRRIESIESRLDDYPCRPREIRPTRLGNVMTVYVRKMIADDPDASVSEEYVLRHLGEWPAALLEQHNECRTKLDMYCTSVFVFTVLTAISGVLLGRTVGPAPAVAIPMLYAAMAWVAYLASIASARDYGAALVAMAKVRSSAI